MSSRRLSVAVCLSLPPLLWACTSDVVPVGDGANDDLSGSGAANAADSGGAGTGDDSGSTGGTSGSGGQPSIAGGAPATGGTASGGSATSNGPVILRIMSLNVWGHQTMPQEAPAYAALIESHNVDVVGIQEGVNDWQLTVDLPTDYSRSLALATALGACWDQRYQVFVNTCRGASFDSHERFDLTDGPNATRTGEQAIISKGGEQFALLDVHWDHEDGSARSANANETAATADALFPLPTFVVGDFNTGCDSADPSSMASQADLALVVNGGIDCIFSRGATGTGMQVDGAPSDHPSVVAEFAL